MLTSIEKLGGAGLANQVNQYNQYTGDPGYLPKDIARLRRVTAADVQRVARSYLQPNARVVVAGVPGKPELGPDPAAQPLKPAPGPPPRPASTATKPGAASRRKRGRRRSSRCPRARASGSRTACA
jgi:zinc protease